MGSSGREHLRVLSIYEGFFCGGARILHTDVLTGLHGPRQQHSVLSIHEEVQRENTVQRMQDDSCYRSLSAAGIPVASLGRTGAALHGGRYTDREVRLVQQHAARSDLLLSLKEQPLELLNLAAPAHQPIVVCLHRSDPHNQNGSLTHLRTAAAAGRIAAAICCAHSAKAAYIRAGLSEQLIHVIPNGVDLRRFHPDPRGRNRLRAALGIPAQAPVILLAARYDPMKNVPLFLRAARHHLQRHRRVRILACGAGMSAANPSLMLDIAAAFADRPDLAARLHLLGVRGDMECVYAAADVVALTSGSGEAAPLCLIEGMMCGAVPVTTDVGDSAAIVAGQGLVTPGDPEAISAAWMEAVHRRARTMGRVTAESRRRFDRNRMLASYAAIITLTGRGATTRSATSPRLLPY